MKDWLTTRRRASPAKPALYWQDESHSFAKLDTKTSVWAARLAGLGVSKGDVVALLLTNQPDYIYLSFAAARLGAVLLTLNTRLTAAELSYQLKAAEAKLLVSEASLLKLLPNIENRLKCATLEQAGNLEQTSVSPQPFDLDAPFCLMFTSGTTGQPKGVRLSLGNFYASATASAFRLGLDVKDNWLCTLPLYHVGGLSILLRACLYGTAVTLHQSFSAEGVKGALESGDISLVSLVPTQLYRLLASDLNRHKNLRLVLLGGAAAGADLLGRAAARGLPVATTYGLTEACSQVATALPETALGKPGTVGRPLLFTDVKILDDKGRHVAANVVGNILVRGPNLMLGYLGGEGLGESDWFNTGDLGYRDDEGDLFIVQRRRDLIVSGGENVYPAEVEQVLREHAAVEDVAVLGLEDAEWGQRVAAAVVLRAGKSEKKEAELEQHCLNNLAAYKRPRSYLFLDALPLTASGKVKKHELTPLFEENL